MNDSICVIIPVYNNARTVGAVIDRCKAYINNIIVIDDGSDDGTSEIIKTKNVIIHRNSRNSGKGDAIKKGLKIAERSGFTCCITIDADGQHSPEDIPKFISALKKNTIIIGVRNFGENVSRRTKIGRRISNFFTHLCTHKRLLDTQSGFRLYPVKPVSSLKIKSNAFDFEVEVLVKSSWKGIQINEVFVSVHYDAPEARVTHFRVFRDNLIISKLWTKLIIMAFFTIPLYYLKYRK